MPDLSDLVPFHSGQGKFLFTCYELTSCIENSVDPDQLATSEAS